MTIPSNITYTSIINIIKNYIKSNCLNVSNFAGIPNQYKTGYTRVIGSASANYIGEGARATIANPVTEVTASTVDSDMATFLTNIGISSSALSYPVDDSSFTPLFTNLAIFCTARVCYAMSNSSNSGTDAKILVYYTGNSINYNQTTKLSPRPLDNGLTYTINMTQLRTLTTNFLTNMVSSARVHPIRLSVACY